jgi:hypothetical protein
MQENGLVIAYYRNGLLIGDPHAGDCGIRLYFMLIEKKVFRFELRIHCFYTAGKLNAEQGGCLQRRYRFHSRSDRR